ncbi:MAG: GGDEF domain-containing protein [Aquabacterium sp.]
MSAQDILPTTAAQAVHRPSNPPVLLPLAAPADAGDQALVRLAALTCGTPAASLVRVHETGFTLQALHGAPPQTQQCHAEAHRHVMRRPDDGVLIADLAGDARFDHFLQGQGFGMPFFAGVPVFDDQGNAAACLAVHAEAGHSLTPAQIQGLRDLASLASINLVCRERGAALAHLTITDSLTGLSNHRHFDQMLAAELAHAMRRGEPFTVLRLDLDGFKDVQDGFGHAAGEEVLKEAARRLAVQVRQGDVLARLDGDSFGIVMRHGAKDSAQVLAKRIVKAVHAPIMLSSGDEIGVGVSIGMAAYSDKVESIPTLLRHAEQALFEAKKQNERRWKMFVGIR